MAGIFQTTKDSGYRDGIKSVTIKALEQRAKAAAEAAAQATQMQEPIANPWQGAAHLAGVLSGQVGEMRADRAAGAARDQLAKLQAGIKDRGNIDPGTLAQIGALDPDQQNALIEQMLAIQNREDTQQHATDLQTNQQEFTGGQNDLNRAIDTRRIDVDESQFAVTSAETSRSNLATEDLTRERDRLNAEIEQARLTETGRSNRATEGISQGTLDATRERDEINAELERRRVDETARSNKATENISQGNLDVSRGQLAETVRKNKEPATANLAVETAAREKEADRLGLPKGSTERNDFILTGNYPTGGKDGTRISFDENGNPIIEQGDLGTQDQKNQANAIESYRANMQASSEVAPTVDGMLKALDHTGYMGPGADWVAAADDILTGAGEVMGAEGDAGILPGSGGPRALFKSGGLDFVLKRVQQTKGAISNAEMGIFEAASPTLSKTREGARLLLQMSKAIIERDRQRTTEAEAWWKSHGGRMDGFEQQWLDKISANPLITIDQNTGMPRVSEDNVLEAPDPNAPAVPAAPAPAGGGGGGDEDILNKYAPRK